MKHLSKGVFLSLLLLTACSKESTTGDAILKQSELTRFEESLVDLTSEQSFIFDIEINNDEITKITGTVDYYENGEFVRQISNTSSEISEEQNNEETIRVALIHQPRNDNEEQWITSFMTEDGHSSGTVENKIDGKARMKFSSGWGIVNEGPLTIGKSKVIGTLAYSGKDGLSIANSIETKEDIKRATDYEQVYLLSVELR